MKIPKPLRNSLIPAVSPSMDKESSCWNPKQVGKYESDATCKKWQGNSERLAPNRPEYSCLDRALTAVGTESLLSLLKIAIGPEEGCYNDNTYGVPIMNKALGNFITVKNGSKELTKEGTELLKTESNLVCEGTNNDFTSKSESHMFFRLNGKWDSNYFPENEKDPLKEYVNVRCWKTVKYNPEAIGGLTKAMTTKGKCNHAVELWNDWFA